MGQGQRVGYVRVSTLDQNTDRQLDGVELDRVFTDHASGKDTNRPQLVACLAYVREGDTLLVHSMDRLARCLDDLRRIVRELNDRGVIVRFMTEGLTFTGNDGAMSQLLLTLLGAVAEFERKLIAERRKEGIEIAKRKGVYKGRKPVLTDEQAADLKARAAAGVGKTELARQFGIGRSSVYQYLQA